MIGIHSPIQCYMMETSALEVKLCKNMQSNKIIARLFFGEKNIHTTRLGGGFSLINP